MNRCKTCWKKYTLKNSNDYNIHTCTPWYHFTKQEKIDKIYEAMADKTLSRGLRFTVYAMEKELILAHYNSEDEYLYYNDGECYLLPESKQEWHKKDDDVVRKIKGHPVGIGDVLDWMHTIWLSKFSDKQIMFLLALWEHKRKPIEEQSDSLISYVYNLIEE